MNPFTTGAELRADGRYSGVALAEESGLSKVRLGGVKLVSSRSRLEIETGVKVAGAAFTGVNPPELTAVNPDDTGGGGCENGGVGVWASNMGIFLMFLSNSSFMEAFKARVA